MAKVIDVPLKI